MIKKMAEESGRLFPLLVLIFFPFFVGRLAAAESVAFSYADSRTLATMEFGDKNHATLNFFNLSPFLVAFKAQNMWVMDSSGGVFLGQVMPDEKAMPEEETYCGSVLIKAWTYMAIEVLGVFPDPSDIRQTFLILGGKRLTMKKAEAGEMEELAARIQEADLTLRDGPQILQRINISPRGRLSYPTGEQDELESVVTRLLGPEEINPPRILSKSTPQLTEEARKAGLNTAQVKLSLSLGKNGEIVDLKVSKGAGYGLDERAMATVRNIWKFLPATKFSDPVATNLTITVVFSSR